MQTLRNTCIAVIIFVLGSTGPSQGAGVFHGMALLYATTDVRDVTLLRAAIALPQKKKNRSWYASWLMILPYGDRASEPFLQIGLLRQAGCHDAVWPFVAYRHQDGKLVFQTFAARHSTKAAVVQIDTSGRRVRLRMDGRTLFETPKEAFFTIGESANLYFQLGDEVSAYGDQISGSISSIEVRRPTGMWAYIPSCIYADYGLSMSDHDDIWSGAGVFSRGKGSFHATWDGSVAQQCG